MPTDEKTIHHAVLDALKNDATLTAYVKSFTIGSGDISRAVFPFLTVLAADSGEEAYSIGPDGTNRRYNFEILCGAKNLAPEKAYSGEHGVLQLCDDIVSVVRPCDFGGIFDVPVSVEEVNTSFQSDSGGMVWIGSIRLRARRAITEVN